MPDLKTLRITPLIRDAVASIVRTTGTFPDSERYGLASQMRRAAISIGANVAEGTGRGSDGDFARSVNFARGSSHELECHVLAASDLTLLSTERANEMLGQLRQISRMLTRFPDGSKADGSHLRSAFSFQLSALFLSRLCVHP